MSTVLAMTVAEFAENARRIAGNGAIVTVAGHGPLWPGDGDYSLVIIYLHPASDGKAWVDGQGNVVLTAAQVREWKLDGAVVFLGTCYGVENSEMLAALLAAGAAAVVAGPGENYGGSGGLLSGADVMAAALRAALQAGAPAEAAWMIARMYASVAKLREIAGAEDALGFQMIKADGKHGRNWGGLTGCLGGALTLAGLMLALVFGMLSPGLTTFTSPAPTLPPSPIRTATPLPTYTPWWAPIGTEVPWPTPTACISGFGCTPHTGTLGIAYYAYMPIVFDSYGWSWSSELFVNGIAAESGATIVPSDSVALIETVDAGGQFIRATLLTQWSASLAYSDTSVNNGSVITDPSYIVMVLSSDSGYGFIGESVFEVLSGSFTTDAITRTLAVYADGAITPTYLVHTTTLSHP